MAHAFKKQFGQNFLRGDRFAQALVDALELKPDEQVIEIGPGDGRVTNLLLQTGAKVTSIEVDYDLLPPLIKRFGEITNFDLKHQDVMTYEPPAGAYKLAGSLPYNISKQIIMKFLTAANKPEKMSFIIQEEVAQEYVAQAPQASFLSNWVRTLSIVKKLVTIPAAQFHPQPKVNGAILQITPLQLTPDAQKRLPRLTKIVELGFRMPRKTLRNNLTAANQWDKTKLDEAWEKLQLSPTVRPAELTSEMWEQLLTIIE